MTSMPPNGQPPAVGGQQPGYGLPAYGAPGGAAPGYGGPGGAAPGYGTPTYGTPTYGTPTYGTPTYGVPQTTQLGYPAPAYGVGGFAPPGYYGSNGPQKPRGKWAPNRLGWSGLDFLLLLLGIVLGGALAFLSAKLQFDAQASGEAADYWSPLAYTTTACATFWFAWAFLFRKPGFAFVLGVVNYVVGSFAFVVYASMMGVEVPFPAGDSLLYIVVAAVLYGLAYEVAVGFTAYRSWGAWMPVVSVILFAVLTTLISAFHGYLNAEIPLEHDVNIASLGRKVITGVALVYVMWGIGNLRFGQGAAQQPFAQSPQYGTPYGQGFPQ